MVKKNKKQKQKVKLNKKPKPIKSTKPAVVVPVEPVDLMAEAKSKHHYFNNALVESLLTKYVQGGCIDVKLRDEIMSHALELLRQIIRTHNFHNIYGGKDPASFNDLIQVGWQQIEKTLYKFDWKPGHTKVFNFWSQVSKTVILAHIKREMRDKKNYGTYKGHLSNRHRSDGAAFGRFIKEAKEMSQYDDDGQNIIQCLEKLYDTDEKPYDGLIGKLVKLTGLSRQRVTSFLKQVRLRSFEFTDSPLNQERNQIYKGSKRDNDDDGEDENY